MSGPCFKPKARDELKNINYAKGNEDKRFKKFKLTITTKLQPQKHFTRKAPVLSQKPDELKKTSTMRKEMKRKMFEKCNLTITQIC
jgi:hypothetical protein